MTENRETFRARLVNPPYSSVFTSDEIVRMELAYMVAKYGHRAQTRKELGLDGNPLRYFEHPRRVALILLDELMIPDAPMVMACLMHDCIEDTDEIGGRTIKIIGGAETTRMVKLLSKKPKEGYLERLTAFADWKTLVVKSCDRKDNLRHMAEAGIEFRRKQIAETTHHYLPLFERMLDESPIRYRDRLYVHCQEIKLLTVD